MAAPYFIFIVTGTGTKNEDGSDLFTPMAPRRVNELLEIFNKDRNSATPAIPIASRPATVIFVWFSCQETPPVVRYSSVSVVDGTIEPNRYSDSAKHYNDHWTTLAPTTSPINCRDNTTADPTTLPFVWSQPITIVSANPAHPARATAFSIVNVYQSVAWAPANSVLSVEFFTHGFFEGPVLNDTSDGSHSRTLRDSTDTDGRGAKDFQLTTDSSGVSIGTMGIDSSTNWLGDFISGFVSGGALRVYGCNIQDKGTDSTGTTRVVKSTTLQVLDGSYWRKIQIMPDASGIALRKGVDPGSAITWNVADQYRVENKDIQTQMAPLYPGLPPRIPDYYPTKNFADWQDIHYSVDSQFFVSSDKGANTLSKTFNQIKGFVARQTEKTYMYLAASAFNNSSINPKPVTISVFGPASGTCGGIESKKITMRLMHCEPSWIATTIYPLFFQAKYIDPTQSKKRYYTLFDSAVVDKIKAADSL